MTFWQKMETKPDAELKAFLEKNEHGWCGPDPTRICSTCRRVNTVNEILSARETHRINLRGYYEQLKNKRTLGGQELDAETTAELNRRIAELEGMPQIKEGMS